MEIFSLLLLRQALPPFSALPHPRVAATFHSTRSTWYSPNHSNCLPDRLIKKFFAYLDSLGTENILAVSHAVTIRMIVGMVILGENLSPVIFEKLFKSMDTENTGITLLEKSPQGEWSLITWNDHAHLG